MYRHRTTRSILVVEDECLLRDELVRIFQDDGWRVLEASTGEGALAIVRKNPVLDVLLTDVQLGGCVSGWDIADAVRATSPETEVIYISGNALDRSRQVCGSHFFGKPYRVAAILATCGGREPTRSLRAHA